MSEEQGEEERPPVLAPPSDRLPKLVLKAEKPTNLQSAEFESVRRMAVEREAAALVAELDAQREEFQAQAQAALEAELEKQAEGVAAGRPDWGWPDTLRRLLGYSEEPQDPGHES